MQIEVSSGKFHHLDKKNLQNILQNRISIFSFTFQIIFWVDGYDQEFFSRKKASKDLWMFDLGICLDRRRFALKLDAGTVLLHGSH